MEGRHAIISCWSPDMCEPIDRDELIPNASQAQPSPAQLSTAVILDVGSGRLLD